MSKVDWGGVFAVGLVTGGGLAVVLLVWVVGLNYCPNSPCNYQNSDPEYVYEVPLGRGPNTTSTFNEADNEGHAQYYERQDLRAQEVMARATNAIVLLTAISVIIGVLGMAALIYTLVLQRNNNEISDRIGRHQLRAYLHFESTIITQSTKGLRASLVLKNFGQTPAHEIRRAVLQGIGGDIPDQEVITDFEEFSVMSNLGPQQTVTYHFDIDSDTVRKINSGADPDARHMKWVGKIFYRDVFGRQFFTAFAYKTNPGETIEPGPLHISPHGNYST
jgi:hypothetical protein